MPHYAAQAGYRPRVSGSERGIREPGCPRLGEVDEDQVALVHAGDERICSLPVVIQLADRDSTVISDSLDIHGMAVVARVGNSYVADPRVTVHWYASGPGVIIPEVGIAASAPVRHITAGDRYPISRPGNALAVVHPPGVDDAVHGSVAPILGIDITAAVLDNLAAAE